MKKVIDGKIYNTETAVELAYYNNGVSQNDFTYIDESLYRTRKGNFFLAGEGGAMTRYAHRCSDNTTCGGEGIFPLTEKEAREWVERNANEIYEEIFATEEA